MRYIKAIVSTILLVLLVQCTATNTKQVMDSWMGRYKSELYMQWGPPTRVTDDGKGGEILIYESYINTGQQPGRVLYHPDGSVFAYTAPQNRGFQQSRMFYVDKSGKIYYWRTVN